MEKLVQIPFDSLELEGVLAVPKGAKGLVLFAHGSGSSRKSPRNNFVARVLNKAGIATLLFDLLTVEEDAVYENRFNIALLTERLTAATRWAQKQAATKKLPLGYFGASTGAASALQAAAQLGPEIRAVVSRGGRPDMAGEHLPRVQSPTLLIVGGEDDVVIRLNEQAYAQLGGTKKLEVIPGATHLFEEPGTLEEAARLATKWFEKYVS